VQQCEHERAQRHSGFGFTTNSNWCYPDNTSILIIRDVCDRYRLL